MSSIVHKVIYDNPSFVGELPAQSSVSIDLISENSAISSSHPEDSSLSNNSGKHSLNIPAHITISQLPRPSVCSLTSNNVPLEQLENFLSDATSMVSPIVALRRLSAIHKIDLPQHLQENYPRSPSIRKLDRWMQSFPVNCLTTLCIVSDVGVVLTDVIENSLVYQLEINNTYYTYNNTNNDSSIYYHRDNYVLVDFVFSLYLLIELFLRIISVGLICFVQHWPNDVDALVTLSTFVFSMVDLLVEDTPTFINEDLQYQQDGFDLDLTYITERIIAMSFPSSGNMSFYRNPISEVVRFLDTKHPNLYKVYNLCSEHSYNSKHFHGRVENFPIDDHNVPTVRQMIAFTTSVRNWLESSPDHVIAVHCKGGKGRTGTMICVWLVEAELFLKAEDSLVYFGSRRTDRRYGHAFQGVETPSQSRYVRYYEQIKKNGLPTEKKLRLQKMRIEGVSNFGKGDGSGFSVEVYINREAPVIHADFRRQLCCQTIFLSTEKAVECLFSNKVPSIQGDVQVVVKHRSRTMPRGMKNSCMNSVLYFWFHCSFIVNNSLRMKREELDNPHKSNTWRYFGTDFAVQLDFIESG